MEKIVVISKYEREGICDRKYSKRIKRTMVLRGSQDTEKVIKLISRQKEEYFVVRIFNNNYRRSQEDKFEVIKIAKGYTLIKKFEKGVDY